MGPRRSVFIFCLLPAVVLMACEPEDSSPEGDASDPAMEVDATDVPGDGSVPPDDSQDADAAQGVRDSAVDETDSSRGTSDSGGATDGSSEPSIDASQVDPDGGTTDGSLGPMDAAQLGPDASNGDADATTDGSSGPMDASADATNASDARPVDSQVSGDALPSIVDGYTCHASGLGRFGPDVILASGRGEPRLITGDLLLATRDDSPVPRAEALPRTGSGWYVWSLETGELLTTSDLVGDTGNEYYLVDAAGETMIVRRGSQSEVRSIRDGHVYPVATPGIARVAADGSYVWGLINDGVFQPTLHLVARTTSGEEWLNADLSAWQLSFDSIRGMLGTANGITLATNSAASTTTLIHFPRQGGAPTTVGPLAGTFLGWFSDSSRVITSAGGTILRVYDLQGTRHALIETDATRAGGVGDVVIAVSDPAQQIRLFRVAATTTPLGTLPLGRIDVLHDGIAVSNQASTWQRVYMSGGNATIVPQTSPDGAQVYGVAASASHLVYNASRGGKTAIAYDARGLKLGCGGITEVAASTTRLFVSTSNAGTFVYDSPFQDYVARLPVTSDIKVAHLSDRFAMMSGESVFVYASDFTLIAGLIVPGLTGVNLSPDGTVVSYSSMQVRNGSRIGTQEAMRLADRAVVFQREVTYPAYPPQGSSAPAISPSNTRFAVSEDATTRLFQNGGLLGVISAGGAEWLDEDRLAAENNVYNLDGILLRPFACYSTNMQWLDAQRVFSGPAICNTVTGQQTQTLPEGRAWWYQGIFPDYGIYRNDRAIMRIPPPP